MNFRTEVFPKKLDSLISHQSEVLSLGSCFSVNIGNKLIEVGIKISNNPFGTIFNPISLFQLINNITIGESLDNDLFVNHNDLYLHHDLHSQFAETNQKALEDSYSKLNSDISDKLASTTHVIITLGTAFTYTHIKTNKIVSNCHKVPQQNFTKRLLSAQEIKEAYDKLSTALSGKQVIFTVSPVRHTHDGIEENSLSKATLLLALNEITKAHKNAYYFPSYEIFMDDLRDYRFYNEDLIHPNTMGINYVWEKFQAIAFDERSQTLNDKIIKIKRAIEHKPFNSKSEEHLQFLQATLIKAKELNNVVNLITEIKEIESRINEFS